MSWTIEPHGKGYALYSGRDDMRHGMNLVYVSEPDVNWEKTKALIAAAPELLEALEDLVDKANDAGWHKELLVSANDAIKKARGEQ